MAEDYYYPSKLKAYVRRGSGQGASALQFAPSEYSPEVGYGHLPPSVGVADKPPAVRMADKPPAPLIKNPTSATAQANSPLSEELYQSYRNMLGDIPTINYTPVAPQFADLKPLEIKGLGEDYFNNQKEILKEKLRNEFFGTGGVYENKLQEESAAGRLGSGVSRGILQKAVAEPFVRASAEIDRSILSSMLEERARVEGFNAEQNNLYLNRLSTLASADSTNLMEAQKANASLVSDYNRLAAGLTQAKEGLLSQEAIAQLDAELRTYQSALEDRRRAEENGIKLRLGLLEDLRREQQLKIEYLRTPIEYDDQTSGQRDIGNPFAQSSSANTANKPANKPTGSAPDKYEGTNIPGDFPKNPFIGQYYKDPNTGAFYQAQPKFTGSRGYQGPTVWVKIG